MEEGKKKRNYNNNNETNVGLWLFSNETEWTVFFLNLIQLNFILILDSKNLNN